jgi:menaquinone-dependent protoporphyrinogen oxidase
MNVLVAYESKHGSTKAIAERIGATLARHDHEANVRPIDAVTDPAKYDAYVIGSAVYYGGWMKQAVEFARENVSAFVGKPVWLFSSGPVGTALPADPDQIAVLRQATRARDHRVFYGALDRSKLSIGERLVISAVKAPDGDFRDWNEIEKWAEGIAQELKTAVLVTA